MGTIEFTAENRITVFSHIITYGHAADEMLTQQIRQEIEEMWNAPHGTLRYLNKHFFVQFKITAELKPAIQPEEILANDNAANNYFRIEEKAYGNISFVDGLGCNTGYFQRDNLYEGSTTAAHEYGHTLGLDHPPILNIRGQGQPGIMYPRGTLVDAAYQYNPAAGAGEPGSTLHPMHRKVLPSDIERLKINKLDNNANTLVIGNFSSIWHPSHDVYLA